MPKVMDKGTSVHVSSMNMRDLVKELRKRKVTVPSWAKKKTLVSLLKRDIRLSGDRPSRSRTVQDTSEIPMGVSRQDSPHARESSPEDNTGTRNVADIPRQTRQVNADSDAFSSLVTSVAELHQAVRDMKQQLGQTSAAHAPRPELPVTQQQQQWPTIWPQNQEGYSLATCPGNSPGTRSTERQHQLPGQTITSSIPLTQNFDSTAPNFPVSCGTGMPVAGRNDMSWGIPSDSLPHVDIISPSMKRDIIMGKDVNLAALLIPGFKNDSGLTRHLVQGSEVIALKTQPDTRLNRALTLSEFIMAFAIYKNVMCEVYPHRRAELDAYERDVVEMSHRFGASFYEYHRAFSARAATLLTNSNIKLDWSQRDTKLFTTIFAGQKANSCASCGSLAHISEFCTQATSNHRQSKQNQKLSSGNTDVRGRPRIKHMGKEICNNFNSESGCKRGGSCMNSHICAECKQDSHGLSRCKATLDKQNKDIPAKSSKKQ